MFDKPCLQSRMNIAVYLAGDLQSQLVMRNGFAGGGRSRLSLRDRYAKAPAAALVPVKTVSRIPAFPADGRRYAESSDTLHHLSRISV